MRQGDRIIGIGCDQGQVTWNVVSGSRPRQKGVKGLFNDQESRINRFSTTCSTWPKRRALGPYHRQDGWARCFSIASGNPTCLY
jgi:hypothetical protein